MIITPSPLTPLVSAKTITGRIALRILNETRFILRRRLRKKVMHRLPVYSNLDISAPAIHMLICKRDFEMAIISAMILNCLKGKAHPFIFHDDGSIDDKTEELLNQFLPCSQLIRRVQADKIVKEKLSNYPNISAFRQSQVLSLKLIDVPLWAKNARIGYMDSDVLFFQYPSEYIRAFTESPEKNQFNRDIKDAYVTDRLAIENATGVTVPQKINSGLWVVNKTDFNFDMLESWLKLPFFKSYLSDYRLEQTFFAMLSGIAVSETSHLPAGYDVAFSKNPGKSICKHYVGKIRYGYELEGLKFIIENDLLK